jgi:D-alanyl-D-alanine dipeptidase
MDSSKAGTAMRITRRDLGGASLAAAVLGPVAARAASPLPPVPRPEVAGLVGEYGTPDSILSIYEAGGSAMANGRGLTAARLTRLNALDYRAPGGEIRFERDRRGVATAANLGGQRLARRDFGAEVQAQIRAGVHADPARVRAEALAATPPAEAGPHRPAELIDLATIAPGVLFDIRYATNNNFMGFPLYERAGAYLQRPAAEAVGRAHRALAAEGYGLLIHDAYRPWFVTKMFWEATPPEARIFVADPAQGSRHNRGCAVDLTLYDLATKAPVEMTGRYDEMSQRSYADYVGGTTRQRWLRDLLRREMEAQGFAVYPQEWWHFDYKDWAQYGIGTATFTELAGR